MLEELMNASFDYQTNNMYTALPGIVVSVRDNLNTLSVDVQPTVNIRNKDNTIKERPVVLNVPVQMPSSRTAAITYPVNVGDPVLLVYTMRGIDTWKRGKGTNTTPSDFRKFDKRDCIAIPGIWPFSESINNPQVRVWQHDTGDVVVVNNIGSVENEVRLKKNGDVVINTNQNVEVNCNNAVVNAQNEIELNATSASFNINETVWTGNILHYGNYTGTGVQTFNGVVFSSHVHGASPPPS